MREVPCPACKGARLKPESLAVLVGGRSIADVCNLPIREAAGFLGGAGADRARAADRRARPQGDPGPARLPARRRPGVPLARPRRGHAVRRRGAADPAGHPDRLRAGRRPVRARRAEHRPAPARQPPAHRHPDPAARPGQHPDRRRARRGHHPRRRLGGRHRPAAPASTAARSCTPGRSPGLLTHPDSLTGMYLSGPAGDRRSRPSGGRPTRTGRSPSSAPASTTCAASTCRFPLGCLVARHRRQRLGQVDAGQRHPLHGAGEQAQRRPAGAGPAQDGHRAGAPRQGRARRPEPDRPHAAVQPGDVHRRLRPHPPAVRRDDRGEGPRLPARPVLVQRQGRPLRGVLRRRHDQDRDELPAGRLRARARSATARGTTARRSRCTSRARRSPTSSTCRSRRPPTSSPPSRRSPGT